MGCFTGITGQPSKQSQQVNFLLLSTLKTILLCIFKFGHTDQIYAKTPKFATPIFLSPRTHVRGLLMYHSTCFFPPDFQSGKKSLIRSPDTFCTISKIIPFNHQFFDGQTYLLHKQ